MRGADRGIRPLRPPAQGRRSMGLTIRPSNPALMAVGRILVANRELLVARWAGWISDRLTQAPHIKRPTVERQLTLLIDILVEMAGPPRRATPPPGFGRG